ncbi:uncharacterized protein LOC116339767 [Contarinia nasturtii]|uniref:uncharacterized protein LOC116339767 n=1 Tax=Contarinia nasturtii TaxID=265458 RepID=UPI0012D4AAC3|nr:uncharacterized protein LOC116339767 [Contarinia nasturtii]
MNRFNIFNKIVLHNSKLIGYPHLTLPIIVQFFQSVAEQPKKVDIIENLRKKFQCSTTIAENIYNEFPSLRSVDAIKNDTLEFLRSKVSRESIIENPRLATLDANNLEKKINFLHSLDPKRLDDFFPLLNMDDDELNKLIARLVIERDEIEQKNRIYYLSEKLKVEPKVISSYRAKCGFEIFPSSFQNYKKKLEILLDYGINFVTNNNIYGLYILRYNDDIFIRRFERMISVNLPIKISYFVLAEPDFNELIEKHIVENGIEKKPIKNISRMKKSNDDEIKIIDSLKYFLQTNECETIELYYNYVNEINKLETVKSNIEYLSWIKIDLETIRQNGFLLIMPIDEIKTKIDILKQMEPKNINDFIPLLSVPTSELNSYKCHLKTHNTIAKNHPIYYFSEKLNMPVSVVAARFAQNYIGFDQCELDRKLDVLMKHNVDKDSIFNYKDTFKYSADKIDKKICKLKNDGLEIISSWMIPKCNTAKLKRMTSTYVREKKLLEGFDDNLHYLAHRLNWTSANLKFAQHKYSKLNKSSLSKIKGHLDYILNETNFTANDITNSLFILNKSLDEIKARINEMTEIGAQSDLKLFTLAAIYSGKNIYLKRIKNYCDTKLPGDAGEKAFAAIEMRIKQDK